MKVTFWCAVAVVFYTYFGYVLWLWIISRVHPAPIRRASYLPFVSVVMVVRNEEKTLPRKLKNLAALLYPEDRLEFIVVSDGSKDSTEQILSEAAKDGRYRILVFADPKGKAAGLNSALAVARGEMVLFVDARQQIEADALRLLMENFAEKAVGCASGELMLGDVESGESEKGMGTYWRIEKKIRELESLSGSVVGATGALYAARRVLLVAIPADTILDDVYLPLYVARQGARVVFDERARAWDSPDLGAGREFRRKVRTLTGNYQLLQIAPWLLRSKNPLRFRFISHKLLRLLVPFALAAMLIAPLLIPQQPYRGFFFLEMLFYTLSLRALTDVPGGLLTRVANAALTLIVLNTAAVVALANFLTRRKEVWTQ
ncbi:MAG TPA: glycosyltransferase family 2 protein [Candidatus Sulfotelmatobacter sp.]|nr:glycosyltransferase family 2 protein [Candidatus Sulfotelmatobacter sp.]